MKRVSFFISLTFVVSVAFTQTLPAGFFMSDVSSGSTWSAPVGTAFTPDGQRLFVWEKNGAVYVCNRQANGNYIKQAQPVLNISDEVGGWRDFGLIGFALDPQFSTNGNIYVLYVVDRHHLMTGGLASNGYNPATNEYLNATIGRVTRYTTTTSSGNLVAVASSRRILLGESKSTGIPILHESHGVGSLAFAADGTLLVTCGDGASYNIEDGGSISHTYYSQALTDGIIRPQENVGAFRAQMLNSHNGKLLRISPETGDGIPSNPFYDASAPRSAKSRVYAVGLRNPFRMSVKPGTGSTNPATGDIGEVFIGEVGWSTWEEQNVCKAAGVNFGWPLYEGHTEQAGYMALNTQNLDEPNIFGACSGRTHYRFKDLLRQDNAAGNKSVYNPCNSSQLIGTHNRHIHARPAIDWRHGEDIARVGKFDAVGTATAPTIGTSESNTIGSPFRGNCSAGGTWYTGAGNSFPPEYKNTFIAADYGGTWIRRFSMDFTDVVTRVDNFVTGAGAVVCVTENPLDGSVVTVDIGGNTVRKITYGGNQPPVAKLTSNVTYGTSPLSVNFTGNTSFDPSPGGSIASYSWNFGGGSPGTSTTANPTGVVFTDASGSPKKFVVKLTVTDNGGATHTDSLIISVNNTPPVIDITSPVKNSTYTIGGDVVYPCTAIVTDAQHSGSQLKYEWQTILRHNNHEHPEAIDNNVSTSTTISRIGCNGDTYYWMVRLKVTDAAGLSTVDSSKIFPNCNTDNTPPTVTTVSPTSGATGISTGTTVTANFNEPINASTVTGTTVQLKNGSNVIAASLSTSASQITLTPSAPLVNSTLYTVTIVGGASGVKDLAGNALASDYTWSFTTVSVENIPPTVTSVSPVNGATGVGTGTPVIANFSEAMNASTVTGTTFQLRDGGNNLVAATISTSGSQITLTPSAALIVSTVYTATITGGASGVKDLAGNALASNYSWSFTTASGGGGGTTYTVFATTATPAEPTNNDGQGIVVGMKIRSSQNGLINGIRYYKGAGTTGTHTGHLWSSTGTLLASTTFSGETSSGWQQALFTTPVAITANITYVASIFSPSGHYAATDPFFTTAVVNGPLKALANGEDGPNGLYQYSTTNAFPTSSFNASNYWVDVVFSTSGGTTVPTITTHPTSQTKCAGASVSFTSAASGSPSPTVQWQQSTNGTTWTNITGATTTTLTFTTTTADNNQQYRAVWTNSAGTVNSNAATLTVNNVPTAPVVNVTNNCGTSLLTASSFTGSLLWSNGATTPSISVSIPGTYTVTQTVNGCTSAPSGNVAAPISVPATPVVSVQNNCGNSVLTATGTIGSLLWSNGATSAAITVSTGGTYTVTQTVNGCTSAAGSNTAAPKAIPPAPNVAVTNNCGNSLLTASGFTGSLLWSNGATTNSITVTTAGVYTVTQTVNGCTSTPGSGTAAPLTSSVTAPVVTVTNNCTNSVLTATGVTGSLLWSNGATTNPITVTIPGTYTVTQTVSGCTSPAGSGVATPVNSTIAIPAVGVTNNCGNSVLSASGFTGSLLWSNGATTNPITVTTPGTYTVTQTINGCTGSPGSGLAAPKPIPVMSSNLTATATSGAAFTYTPASVIPATTFSWSRAVVNGISNGAATGTNAINETLVNTTASPVNVTYVYTLTAAGCTNTQNLVVTVNPASVINCVVNGSIVSNFNSTSIPAGRYIWFNSVFDRGSFGGITGTVTYNVTNSVITFTANSLQYTLNVPNSRIRFDAAVTSATTQFVNGMWETAVPRSYSGYVFMGGLSYQVPSTLPGNISNVRWTANISIDKVGASLSWKWAAAVYTSFAAHSGLNIKPKNGSSQNPYPNNDNAGTPENFKSFLVSGAKGTGGTNYTGTYSSTSTATCVVTPGQRATEEPFITRKIFTKQIPKLPIDRLVNENLEVSAVPNPSNNIFNLSIKGNSKNYVQVRVTDVFGRIVEHYEKGSANTILQIGQKLRGGSYFVEVIQGDRRQFIKIIKAN